MDSKIFIRTLLQQPLNCLMTVILEDNGGKDEIILIIGVMRNRITRMLDSTISTELSRELVQLNELLGTIEQNLKHDIENLATIVKSILWEIS